MAHKSFEIDQFLSGIYYTIGQPGSYSGVRKLWNEVKKRQIKPKGITLSVVGKWLKDQETAQMYAPARKTTQTQQFVPTSPFVTNMTESIFSAYARQMWEVNTQLWWALVENIVHQV